MLCIDNARGGEQRKGLWRFAGPGEPWIQDVAITSYPDTARVIIDGEPKGTTPLVASLWRGGAHVVRFERDGQEPIEQSITRDHFHFWAAGNLATPLCLGLLIDAWTGGL